MKRGGERNANHCINNTTFNGSVEMVSILLRAPWSYVPLRQKVQLRTRWGVDEKNHQSGYEKGD